MPNPLTIHEIDHTIRDCVCAQCWGTLVKKFAPNRMYYAVCANEPQHEGYVTRQWVARQKAESRDELREVLAFYLQLDPEKQKKTPDECINDLGYGG